MNFNTYIETLDKITAPQELKRNVTILMNKEKSANKRFKLKPLKTMFAVVLLIVISTITVFAVGLFSSLEGDEFQLSAEYKGNGVVTINVKNFSEKPLRFQEDFKLKQWNSGKDISRISDKKIKITNLECAPKSNVTMTIDLSGAYDINELEKPLTDDWYYFIFTNNNFMHGQDWQCSIKFSEPNISAPPIIAPVKPDEKIIGGVDESLKFYFEDNLSYNDIRASNPKYVEAYEKIAKDRGIEIIKSVIYDKLYVGTKENIIFDKNVSADKQLHLWGEYFYKEDTNRRDIATKDEFALTILAMLPMKQYKDSSRGLPLFYILTYEKSSISSPQDNAFIYGQFLTFEELEDKKVYEDDKYVCYEVSSYIYSDLNLYIDEFVKQNPDIIYNKQIEERVINIYNYFNENLSSLFLYHE